MAEESGRQRVSHRKQFRNKANIVSYLQLLCSDLSEDRLGLRVALRTNHRTLHRGSISSFAFLLGYTMNTA